MSAQLPEIVRWRYHARELQATAIFEEAESKIDDEIDTNTEPFKRIDALLLTPPVILNAVIDGFRESKDQFYKGALNAVKILANRVRSLEVLMRLNKACEEEADDTKEVAIDFIDLTVPLPIREAFKGREEEFEQAVAEGRENAAKRLLLLTQDKTPLMRYRRDLALIKFHLSPTLDGGLLGYIPTKLDEVDLKFWYPKAESLPKLAYRVKPFEIPS